MSKAVNYLELPEGLHRATYLGTRTVNTPGGLAQVSDFTVVGYGRVQIPQIAFMHAHHGGKGQVLEWQDGDSLSLRFCPVQVVKPGPYAPVGLPDVKYRHVELHYLKTRPAR